MRCTCSFAEYVREYGFAAMEGLLLRHLHQTWKTLEHSVPESHKDDGVVEIAQWLRATLEQVDSSLVKEWEALLHPPEDIGALEVVLSASAAPIDVLADRRRFIARVRAELHQLVRALASRDYEAALSWIRDVPDRGGESWTVERLEQAIAPYYAEHAALVVDARARTVDRTLVEELEPRFFRVRHTLVDPEDSRLWAIEGFVDVRERSSPDGVLFELDRIFA